MCEQTSVNYNKGDVVWAKLGPCWWPGEVVLFEELPSDITESFKKPPLAVVKFFDEEKYEFIRQWTHIHTYNTSKKYEFIKKGLDLHRGKHGFMDKFPGDVCTAETKTGGDPNILNDPRLTPDKKPNYSSIFGSPPTKKSTKDSPSRGKNRSSTGKLHSSPGSPKKTSTLITHPRFLGKDDSEIRILVQTPMVTKLPETEYRCFICGFKSTRIEVIVIHNKSHLRGSKTPTSSPKKTKKTPVKRTKKKRLPTSKTATIDEDLALLRQGLPVCSDHSSSDEDGSDSDEEPLIKRKAKAKTVKPKKVKAPPPVPEVKKQTDIRTDLLAEWDDEEDEEETVPERISPKVTEQPKEVEPKKDVEPPKPEEKDKSCFDFVEDEDDLLTTLEGRKIPRVIPPTEKRKSIQEIEKDTVIKSRSASPKIDEDNVIKPKAEKKTGDDIIVKPETEISKESIGIENTSKEDETVIAKKRESRFQLEFEAFNNALRETTVSQIVDIPPIQKCEQNFYDTETIKFPDKSDDEPNLSKETTSPATIENTTKNEENKPVESNKVETPTEVIKEPVVKNTEVATKLTNPKKRFVKTFEDETKNSSAKEALIQEKKEKPDSQTLKNELKSLEVSKLKTQLMKKLVDVSPKKDNSKLIERSKKGGQKNKRYKVFVESIEEKDKKRSLAESVSDSETRAHVKKKKYSSENKDISDKIEQLKSDTVSEVMDVQTQLTLQETAKDNIIKDRSSSSVEIKSISQLEYLNSSPSKIFSDLHIDRDELLDANNLSESQKLTIQDIIGVSSPSLTFHQPLNDMSKEKEAEKMQVEPIQQEKEDIAMKDSVEKEIPEKQENQTEAEKIPEKQENQMGIEKILEKQKNQMEIEEIPENSKNESNELSVDKFDKTVDVIDQPMEEIVEEKIDCVTTNNQIYEVSEKLDEDISEKLPDEIIETSKEEIVKKSMKDKSEKSTEEIIKGSTEEEMERSEKTEEEIKKSDDEIEKPIEESSEKATKEEIEETVEEKFEKVVEEKFEKVVEEKSEKVVEEKSEKVIEEKSEKVVEEKYEEDIEEQSEKAIEEFERAIEEKLEKIIEEKTQKLEEEENEKMIEEEPQTSMIEEAEETVEASVEKPKENIETQLSDPTIEKQEDDVKESLVDVENDTKKDLQISLESMGKNIKSMFHEEEMVNIEGNVTVVTERDLADKQVEIAATPEVSKPITLTSFSMDFCEDVESYVKGETIMQTFSKSKSISPVEEKNDIKDDTQKDASKEENKDIPHEEIIEETKNYEAAVDKKKKVETEQPTLDIQNDENVDTAKSENKLKKFDDIITPAKDEPPSVIIEGFEEPIKDVPEDPVAIDETNLNVQATESADTTGKVLVEDKENKEQTTQDIIKEISQKEEIIIPPIDISVESEVAKITDSIAEQEVVIQDKHHSTTSTKLLEILTDKPKSSSTKTSSTSPVISRTDETSSTTSKTPYKHAKFSTRHSTPSTSKTSKTAILPDKLIKPLEESKTISVKKVTSKRSYQDVEDIDTYIIQKPVKKLNVSTESDTTPKILKKTPVISKGKARILQQTIITPTGDILQPPVSQSQTDDNMFDINSMPIVLSDQILTPESIENMQIVLQENTTAKPQITPIKKPQVTTQQVKLLNKTQTPTSVGVKETVLKNTNTKSYTTNKQKAQKVYPTSSATKLLKNNTNVIAQPGKQGKFIIVPASTTATGSKYTVGKRPAIVKKPPQKVITPISKVSDIPITTSSGGKIMFVKGHGPQQKIVLSTPQKQITPAKMKGRPIGQKQILAKESPQQKGANIISQTIVNSKGQITTLASSSGTRGQIVASMAQQNRNIKIDPAKLKKTQQRVYIPNEITKPSTSGQQRTIIIKNPQGQTVKKIQGTDDALLDQQVAEQLQAISRASANQQLKDISPKTATKLPPKKPFLKRQEPVKQVVTTKNIIQSTSTSNKSVSVPPLAPISPIKKVETQLTESGELTKVEEKSDDAKRPPHQLVIQDSQGNQTTITEGQILALPSEAIDGQPHSYVLVTLDETGNLTPLNSEALMSLDPNLNLTTDLGNMVLQIDQGGSESETQATETPQRTATENTNTETLLLKESVDKTPVENVLLTETPAAEAGEQNVQAVINSGEMGQLIITGDAVTAQKFLESLAEGNADLANLLANAEGNVLIQADGQQILINTDSESPMLVMNPESISNENSEGSGNPVFASQPVKNQDILAAALADTDVFQQDPSISHSPSKVAQSQLSPSSTLYPMNVGNVLETNSMSSPIMTPLEVPSTNSKKIDDESEILNQVPKNVDLPITITDPNISQTVAQQQVASLMATELPTSLDIPLAIQDPGMSVTSTEMNSPSFVYSLPTLDDTVDINQKAFSGSISMPLLTEEPEDAITENSTLTKDIESKETKTESDGKKDTEEENDVKNSEANKDKEIESDDKKTDFIDSEGLCAMRGGICNSLSEPPPDMFDFSVGSQSYNTPHIPQTTDMDIPMGSTPSSEVSNTNNDRESSVSSVEERKNDDATPYTVNTTSPSTNTDDSCEIPLQPPIIAKSFEENGTNDSKFEDNVKTATDGDV